MPIYLATDARKGHARRSGGLPQARSAAPAEQAAAELHQVADAELAIAILVEDRVFEKAERIPPKGGSAPTL